MLKHHLSFIFITKAERGIAALAYDLTSVEFGAFFLYTAGERHICGKQVILMENQCNGTDQIST
jgi:hypothetical protein